MKQKKREFWIDYIKVFACALVVIGHFFQSMVKSNILPNNDIYRWFDTTIYYFHVPLFFICSGYLYQATNKINNIASWRVNVVKKIVTLCIPYLAFSIITWIIKTVFSNSVNDQLNGVLETLFLKPVSPYWFLYCLFLIFLITPTINGKKSMIGVVCFAVLGKLIALCGINIPLYAIRVVLINEIWFVMGMLLTFVIKRNIKVDVKIGYGILLLFLTSSISIFYFKLGNGWMSFLLGTLACAGFIIVFHNKFCQNCKVMDFCAQYTMSIFLMHTIFAAAVRIILLKIGVKADLIHIILGMSISFIGPIIMTEIMKKIKWIEFFVYPGKYIKLR